MGRSIKVAIILGLALVAGCSFSARIEAATQLQSDNYPSVLVDNSFPTQDITARSAPDNMRAVFDNLGRVRAYDQSGNLAWLGSGNIIKKANGYLNILTNSHVAGSKDHTYTVEFFRFGVSLGEFGASTIGHTMTDSLDIAVLEVKEVAELRDLPAFYPVVRELEVGQEIFKVGCARGEWPIGRIGHIVDITEEYIIALPKAIGGVSGSSIFIFDDEGQPEMVGLTAWSLFYSGETHAMSMKNMFVVEWLSELYSRPLEDIVEPEADSAGLMQKLLDRIRDLRDRNDREFGKLGDRLRRMELDRESIEATVAQLRDDNEELLAIIEEHDKDIEEAKVFNGTIMQWLRNILAGVEKNSESNGSITEKLNDSFASVKIIMSFIKLMAWGLVALLVASLFFKQGWATTLIIAVVTFFFKTLKLAYQLLHHSIVSKKNNPESTMDAINDIREGISEEIGLREDDS